jgi:hypothetical protein
LGGGGTGVTCILPSFILPSSCLRIQALSSKNHVLSPAQHMKPVLWVFTHHWSPDHL